MIKKRNIVLAIAGLFATAAIAGNGVTPKASTVSPVAADQATNAATGDAATRKLLLLMDTDKDGMVSREEFLAYMGTEFDRLDQNKDGKLDVKELTQLHVRSGSGVHR